MHDNIVSLSQTFPNEVFMARYRNVCVQYPVPNLECVGGEMQNSISYTYRPRNRKASTTIDIDLIDYLLRETIISST